MESKKPLGQANYEQFARRYAERAPTKPHNAYLERPATLSLLDDVDGKRVLDAGCGPGIYTDWLVDRGAEVVAFDVTPEMVELARERLGDRATIVRADFGEPLDFAQTGSFDVVLCPLALEYVRDWGPVFREFARVLKPDGLLVYSSGHPVDEFKLSRDILGPESNYFEVEEFAMEWSGFGEPRPLVGMFRRPLQEMLNPLIEAGFSIERILEPTPTEEFRRAAPDDYVRHSLWPIFFCVRAIKRRDRANR